jgi:hypothetical protein
VQGEVVAEIDLNNLVIYGDWLAYDTGEHNCVGGDEASSGVHEEGCGLEPVASLQEVWNALNVARIVRDKPLEKLVKCDRVMRLEKKSPGFQRWTSVELDTPEVDATFEKGWRK